MVTGRAFGGHSAQRLYISDVGSTSRKALPIGCGILHPSDVGSTLISGFESVTKKIEGWFFDKNRRLVQEVSVTEKQVIVD